MDLQVNPNGMTIADFTAMWKASATNKFREAAKPLAKALPEYTAAQLEEMPIKEFFDLLKQARAELLTAFQNGNGSEKDIVIDVSLWTMGDFDAFAAALEQDDFLTVAGILAKIVTAWPFKSSPNKVANYMKLGLDDFGSIIKAVNAGMVSLFRPE